MAEKLTPMPDYGDLMTIGDFAEECKNGMFINYDGTGYLATDDGVSRIPIDCKAFKERGTEAYGKEWTHVAWFNR